MSRRQSVLRVSLADVRAQPPFRLLVRPMTVEGAWWLAEWRYRELIVRLRSPAACCRC